MTVLEEGSLQVSFDVPAWKFDGSTHGLSHCMKAVDFIVELPDRYLFIEFKDPDNPGAKAKDRSEFISRFEGGQIDEDLKCKYRDSFLYEWAAGRAEKPIHYLVLVAIEGLREPELMARANALGRKLPLLGPQSGSWTRSIVSTCHVFNIASWNRMFPNYPVTRVTP